ncbi:MAG: DUF4399 domain-containing protein [Woeseiaceae bacterium]|nr:DUF4399 domain-containing protein [Woeseiaceae bacterium]
MSRTMPVLAAAFLVLSACSSETNTPPEEPAADDVAETVSEAASETESAPVALPRSASPDGARVFFITPADGDTVQSPVNIEFGIENMEVAPAGQDTMHSGHHHLIINAELPAFDQPIPADDNYRHFGDGSTSTSLELEPGTYKLQMILGDYLHIPHDPPIYSDPITITVE